MILMTILSKLITEFITEICQHPLKLVYGLVAVISMLVSEYCRVLARLVDLYLVLLQSLVCVSLFLFSLYFVVGVEGFLEF